MEINFTQIPNPLLEKLHRYRIPGEQRLCFDYIVRKTYGYHLKRAAIPRSEFSQATGLRKQNVARAIKALKAKRIIRGLQTEPGKAATYSINTRYSQWVDASKPSHGLKTESSEQFVPSVCKEKDIVQQAARHVEKRPYKEIIGYLNEKTGKNFKHASTHTRKLINARFNDGYTLKDFKKVVDVKTAQWRNKPDQERYLRPRTLFGNKFEDYVNESAAVETRHTESLTPEKIWELTHNA